MVSWYGVPSLRKNGVGVFGRMSEDTAGANSFQPDDTVANMFKPVMGPWLVGFLKVRDVKIHSSKSGYRGR